MSKKRTTSDFQNLLNELFNNQFDVLSEYVNNETKVKLLCKHCGHIIFKSPAKMTGKTKEGCYICSGKNHFKTKQTLQHEVDIKYPNTYEILGEYVKARQPLTVRRLACGHVYDISPDNLLRGKGCPRCSLRQSSYMNIVETYFAKNNIKYVKEKRFDDCMHIRVLPFDYYIEDKNICIEVDGQFHYMANKFEHANPHSSLESITRRDDIKTRYCQEHNIKLIRLPYFEAQNFEKILDKELYADTEINNASNEALSL